MADRFGAPPTTPARDRRIATTVGLPLAGGVTAVAAWWIGIIVFDLESYIVPTPPAVVSAFGRMPGYLVDNAGVTLMETLQGFAVAVAAGVLIGAAIASSDIVGRALYPVLIALNAVPKLALLPLLLVWMGYGQAPKVVMVLLICFFPIVLSTATGLTTTPSELVELSRSLSARRWQTFVKVRIHAALPHIFVGLKTAMPLAVIGAVVAEMFGASEGLGFIVQNAASDTALAFAAIALLAAMSILLFYAVVLVERLLLPWVRETTA